ncbi:MAG: amidohydrolase family protein [Phycisphaerae bacterium]|nr:amidohydrolase family protein [Phycisphaerae bacterium]
MANPKTSDVSPAAGAFARPASDLRLFDAWTLVGATRQPPLQPALTAETLLAEMDRCGVDEAMVSSASVDGASPVDTNPALSIFRAASERLHPIYHILPTCTGEIVLDTFFDDMRTNGVRALAADPEAHRYLLNGLTFGDLFEAMIEKRVPLYLKSDWSVVTAVLKEFPELIVIVRDLGSWGADRFCRPILDAFPNVHVEISTYKLDGGVPALLERYGPERILYGSGYHTCAMGGPAMRLRNLDIDRDAKEQIAHGNLERLLREARP